MHRHLTATSLAIAVAALSGCSDERTVEDPKTPYAYTVTVHEDSDPLYDEIQPVAGLDEIVIEDKIAYICEIPTPNFAFDSAKLRDRVEPSLDELAFCLTDGALQDATVILVGQADPRGTTNYNLELGQMRSLSVADYLIDKGVVASRLLVTSRGERGAEGGPGEWADDRRVQIILRD